MNPIRISEFLRSLLPLEALEDCALTRLAGGITVVDVRKGAVLLRRGDPCTGFHIVVFGQIKVSLQTPKGDAKKVLDLLGPGKSFGESAMFLGLPYRVTVEALTDSKVLHVPKATVMAEIDRNAMFAHSIMIGLSQHLNYLIGHIEGHTLQSGTQRVIGYLLSQLSERMQPGKLVVRLPVQKSVIASQLDLTQEHFSRILRDLAAGGLIEVRGRFVHIHDMAALRYDA